MSDLEEIKIEEYEKKREDTVPVKLGKKKGIKPASWNIRGKNDSTHNSKWPKIARIMMLKRIAILEIQEARTTEDDVTGLEGVVPKIKIITNGQYSSKMGVVFAINKDLVDDNNLQHEVMMTNRVSQSKVKWGDNQELRIIIIYTSNDEESKIKFFKKTGKHDQK